MARSTEHTRTSPEADGFVNPFAAEMAKKAAELIFGKPDIIPSKLATQPYMTGQEHYVEQLVAQNTALATSYDINMARKDFEPGEDGQLKLFVALNESVGRITDSIAEATGVVDVESRALQVSGATLEKWIRAATALALKRETYTESTLSSEDIIPVISSLLGEKDPGKWSRSKLKRQLEGSYEREEDFIEFLQDYVDNFDTK